MWALVIISLASAVAFSAPGSALLIITLLN